MIDRREIIEIATRVNLNPHVVEKDYVLGWVLAGIYSHEELRDTWLFKGGTCLKKCFFETYRFSEDLDFTLLDPSHLDETFLKRVFAEIGAWVYERTGIEVPTDGQDFEFFENPRGNLSCQGKLSYKGPVSPTRPLPRIKLDLTADEKVVLPPVHVPIFHLYSDAPEEPIEVLAYDYVEAFAEKFRALAERTRPRDLYDVVHLYRNTNARPEPVRFVEVLRIKCEFKGIAVPSMAALEPHRDELAAGWANMLNHQLPALLPLDAFWDALPEIFAWLAGLPSPAPPVAFPIPGTLIRERVFALPAGAVGQSHIEIIRFAAANQMLVEIDYRDAQGALSRRAIEAYSLRRSQAGDVLLMAVQASDGQARSFRLDRILGVTSTQRSFSPRYPIELTPFGVQPIPAASRAASFPAVRRLPTGRARARPATGPTYVYRCTVCHRQFERKTHVGNLRPHKNRAGRDCYGRHGTYVRTKF